MTFRKARRGFWDEDLQQQVDAIPFPSAEEEFFAEAEEPADEPCTHEELYEAMQHLTARQNFVIRLYYGIECEAMTTIQIASLLGVTHQTVSDHLATARQHLERNLRDYE